LGRIMYRKNLKLKGNPECFCLSVSYAKTLLKESSICVESDNLLVSHPSAQRLIHC
jgi:hypothetical protein